MAEVTVEGNRLVVICRGTRKTTAVTVDPEKPKEIERAVKRAIASASGFFYGLDEALGREVEGINAAAEARKIRDKLGIETAKEKGGVRREPKRERRGPAPKAAATPPEPRKAKREPGETRPKPSISQDWVDNLLRDARWNDRKAQDAASRSHAGRAYLNAYLQQGDNARNSTMALFNSLYLIPGFRLYLSALAEQQRRMEEGKRTYPEFIALQSFLSDPKAGEKLSAQAQADIISAADTYIRYYLFDFVAGNNKRFRDELIQIDKAKERLDRIENVKSLSQKTGRPANDPEIRKLMRLQLAGAMDANTLTAGILYIRRWQLEHPSAEKGKTQEQIALWKAPKEIVPEEKAAEPAQKVPGPGGQPVAPQAPPKKTPLEEFADRNWRNLAVELYQSGRLGRPAGIVTLSRNLPEGVSSIEEALSKLNRQDLNRAYERIFNEFLHTDREFLNFCTLKRDYAGVARPSVALGPDSNPADRRLVLRAIAAFINDRSERNEEWYGRFKGDLKLLLRDAFKAQRETLDVNGSEDMKTFAAVALFSWRRANRHAAVGEWAGSLGLKPTTTPPQTQVPQQPEIHRRRTIIPGRDQ